MMDEQSDLIERYERILGGIILVRLLFGVGGANGIALNIDSLFEKHLSLEELEALRKKILSEHMAG